MNVSFLGIAAGWSDDDFIGLVRLFDKKNMNSRPENANSAGLYQRIMDEPGGPELIYPYENNEHA